MNARANLSFFALALALATLSIRPASADPCAYAADGMPTGPVVAGLLDGDLGTAHRVCGRTEVGVGGGGALLVDLPNFYGHLSAGLSVDASLAVTDRLELFGSMQLLRHESVITPIPAAATGLGSTALGAGYRVLSRERWALGVNGKFVLPTAVGIYSNAWPVGYDLGFAGQFTLHPRVLFHSQAGVLGSAAISDGPAAPRFGLALTSGIELRPGRAFAFIADLHANFGYRAPLDNLSIAMGLRFSDGKRFGFELAGVVPLAGQDRTMVALELRVSVRMAEITPYAPPVATDWRPGAPEPITDARSAP